MIEIRWSSLRQAPLHGYVLRFLFGGTATVVAGIIAKHYGPGIGGLFLAFPAIFPASAALIESTERRRKRRIGANGTLRGRMAASIDATGTAIGCIALFGFAFVIHETLSEGAWIATSMGIVGWICLACGLWRLRKTKAWRTMLRIVAHYH